MEKVNNLFKKMSLKKALLIITSMIIFFVTILSTLTILITTNLQHKILNTRSITINNTSSTYQVETGIVYKLAPDSYSYGKLSTSNQINYYLTISLMIILPTTYIILGTVLIVKIYYRIKLQVPIKLLKEGIDCIANQDLTFKIPYDSYDEYI